MQNPYQIGKYPWTIIMIFKVCDHHSLVSKPEEINKSNRIYIREISKYRR